MIDFTKHPRFWNKVNIGKPDECWEWTAFRNNLGYGRIFFEGKSRASHRIAWEIVNGAIENGFSILHRCDNRACVNPSHLFLGTQLDNIKDMDAKGRRRNNPLRGENSPSAKITEKDVYDIRSLHESGKSLSQIAKIYNICFQQISRIVNKTRWTHVK